MVIGPIRILDWIMLDKTSTMALSDRFTSVLMKYTELKLAH